MNNSFAGSLNSSVERNQVLSICKNRDAHLGSAPMRLPRKKGWDYGIPLPLNPLAKKHKTRTQFPRLDRDLMGYKDLRDPLTTNYQYTH